MDAVDRRTMLEGTLDSFDPGKRSAALKRLVEEYAGLWREEGSNVNMHFHSFFSFNAEGYSPARIVWESRHAGLYAASLCDFDVLDGLEEFLSACRTVGLRGAVDLETRAYLKEFAEVDINSPGEPGVTYVMGAGFYRLPVAGSAEAEGLAGYRQRARERNVALIERINANVPDIAIDYEADVLPLTPTGAATERHIVRAYVLKAISAFEHPDKTAEFWTGVLGRDFEETVSLMADEPALEEVVRAKFAKRGGVGYVQPSIDTFPIVDDFIRWVASCDAIPMMTWLDGTSDGEQDPGAMLDCMVAKGAAALNIIPDRNWNISDPDVRAIKQENLKTMVEVADAMDIPINIGTEMNKRGLPFTDDLDVDALAPFKETFLRGARVMVGHSLLARYAGFSYIGKKAEAEFGNDRKARNAFFEAAGALPALTAARAAELEDMGADKALAHFRAAIGG